MMNKATVYLLDLYLGIRFPSCMGSTGLLLGFGTNGNEEKTAAIFTGFDWNIKDVKIVPLLADLELLGTISSPQQS